MSDGEFRIAITRLMSVLPTLKSASKGASKKVVPRAPAEVTTEAAENGRVEDRARRKEAKLHERTLLLRKLWSRLGNKGTDTVLAEHISRNTMPFRGIDISGSFRA